MLRVESFTAMTGIQHAVARHRLEADDPSRVSSSSPLRGDERLRRAPDSVSTQRRTGGAKSSRRLSAIMCKRAHQVGAVVHW